MIRIIYAKLFEGLKITTTKVIHYINMFEFSRNINNLKINIT